MEKQSLTAAAETLGGHQGECAVLASDITGESAYIPQLLWEGESGLGEVETAWKGLNFCPVRLKEERDEPVTGKEQTHLHHKGTRVVCRPKVHVIYTVCDMYVAKYCLEDLDHTLAPRKMALVFLVWNQKYKNTIPQAGQA